MSDWYARKLARYRQEQPPPPPQARAYQGHIPVSQPQQPQQQGYNNLPVPDTPPNGATNIANFFDMTRLWKGGKAHRVDPDPCPECGSPQFYSRTEGNLRGPPPAPHCYNCFAGTVTYLTADGNKTFADTVGTVQQVLNHEGKWVEAEIKEFGHQPLQIVTFRPGLRRSNLRHTVMVTPDHRWLTQRGEVTDLEIGDDVRFVSPGIHQPLADAEAWIRGFGFGDGTVDARGQSRVRLCGDKARHESLFDLFGRFSRYEYDGDPLLIYDKGVMEGWKALPAYADAESLSAWLWGYIAADGEDKDGYWRLSSQDSQAVDFVKEAAPYAGLMVTGHNIESNMETNLGPRAAALHRLTLRPDGVFRVVGIEQTDVEDTVFCAVVPDGHSFTLANGIITGNCGYNGIFTQGLSSSWASQ